MPATDASSHALCCTTMLGYKTDGLLSNKNGSVKTDIDFTHSSYVYHFHRCKSH